MIPYTDTCTCTSPSTDRLVPRLEHNIGYIVTDSCTQQFPDTFKFVQTFRTFGANKMFWSPPMVLILAYKNYYTALYIVFITIYIVSGACSHFHFLLSVRQSGFANYTAQYTCIKYQLKQCGGIDRYIPRDLCHAPAPIIPVSQSPMTPLNIDSPVIRAYRHIWLPPAG